MVSVGGSSSASKKTNIIEEEEERADAGGQHGEDIEEDEESILFNAEVHTSEPSRHPRRKRTITQWPGDTIDVTELTPDGMPIERKAHLRMRKLAGLIARQRISLVLPSFSDLSEEDKKLLFDECVHPFLVFSDELKVIAYKNMMQMIAKSWRTHKSDLVRTFIRKGLDARVKHPYIPLQDWQDFVTLQESENAKARSEKYKKLRERHVHVHHLGTGGYAGMAQKWEQEDRELASAGITNPWDTFPLGRSRNWLRARSKLVKSEGTVEIHWLSESAESLSHQILEKQAALESSGVTSVRERDVLTEVLGRPEQTRRVRGVSSYSGWKYWPDCTSMYRKRKHVDVEAIKEEVRSQVTQEVTEKVTQDVTEKVTNDIMTKLLERGIDLRSPSNPTSMFSLKSSCASASGALCNVQLDLLIEPTLCTLVINPGGYQVVVARGRVFPQQKQLYSVPVQDGYAIVLIDFVYPEHEGYVLSPPISRDEVRTLGEALFIRVQWSRTCIQVSPKASSPNPLRSPLSGSAKINLKDLVVPHHVSSSPVGKANSASKAIVAPKNPTKSTHAASEHQRSAKSDTFGQQVGVKQHKQLAERAKSLNSAPTPSIWVQANPKFQFGQPLLSAPEVQKAGPGCVALNAHYMKAVAENGNTGIVGMFKHEHFLRELELEPLPVGYEDLFDLFTLGAMDMALLRCLTLSLIVEARDKRLPVGLLDPDPLSIETLTTDRDYSVRYLEKGLRKHANKDYVMFAHNCGGHWIAVVIISKWGKVLYLDSIRGSKKDLSGLKSLIDEAFSKSIPKKKNKTKNVKLTHATKFVCQQQPLDNTCGFYVSHNLMLAMGQTNLDAPEDFEVLTIPINLEDIREKIAMFIMSQIADPKGEFHLSSS